MDSGNNKNLLFISVLLSSLWCMPAVAVFIPIGLNPGDTYHLAFVSSTTRNATSSDIADYNDHVQAAADAASAASDISGLTWNAIGSTSDVNAIDNVNVTGPVYLLDGTKVANDSDDMFDGSLQSGIGIDENGNDLAGVFVWTGSTPDGFSAVTHYLGSVVPTVGFSGDAVIPWIEFGAFLHISPLHLYGVSTLLTVPVPAPPTALILLVGVVVLWRRRWQQRL